MGERHAEAYSHINSVELVGFADKIPKKSDKLAKKFRKKSFSVEALIKNEKIEAINVCTPTIYHAENTIDAISAGKHVLVEKPMATKLSDCKKMIDKAKKTKVNLMIGQTYRFYPSSIKAKEILDSGIIGKVKMVLDFGLEPGHLPRKAKSPHWMDNRKYGGGVFFDTIHSIDKLRYWFNAKIKKVNVPLMDTLHKSAKAEQLGIANLFFSNKIVATILPISPSWGVRDTITKIIGTDGALYITYGGEVKVGKERWKNYSFKHKSFPANYRHNLQGFINEMTEFVNSIREKRNPLVTGEDGQENLRVVLAMYESYNKNKTIIL